MSIQSSVNKITQKGASALADMLKTNSNLTTIYLEGKKHQTFTFQENKLQDKGATAIADMLKVNSSLTSIELWGF